MNKRAKPQTLQTMRKVEPYIWLLPSIMPFCKVMGRREAEVSSLK